MCNAGNALNFAEMCVALGIGDLRSQATPVTGGLLHEMWRLETDCGTFALKLLNPEIMARPSAPLNYRHSEEIARVAKKHGVPAIVAKEVGEDPWIQVNGLCLMLFNWQDGRSLRAEECSVDGITTIGQILAQLHNLDIQIEGLQPTISTGIPDGTWKGYIQEAQASISCWGFSSAGLLENVLNWSQLYRDAAGHTTEGMVISHRDLDPKNVIWGGFNAPYVIDWESAGYVNPSVELLEAAVNWRAAPLVD